MSVLRSVVLIVALAGLLALCVHVGRREPLAGAAIAFATWWFLCSPPRR